MKNFLIAMIVALLPLAGVADTRETVREPAAKKERAAKKKKASAKSSKKSGKKSVKKVKKAKKAKTGHKSHAPRMEEPAAASVGEIPENMKDDLPPPNNGDLTE